MQLPPAEVGRLEAEEQRRIRELEARKQALLDQQAAKEQHLARVDSLLNQLSQTQRGGSVQLPAHPPERERLFELHRHMLDVIRYFIPSYPTLLLRLPPHICLMRPVW